MVEEKEQITALIQQAQNLVDKFGDNQNHTMAAAVLSANDEIYTGLNVYHFTGGPCAEISAMASAVSSGSKQLVMIVSVGNNNRGIISPCGRCRQILFDYFPNIKVINKKDSTLPIGELLPEVFDWNKNQ